MRSSFLIIAIQLLCFQLFSQTGKISGKIISSENGTAITGVSIEIVELKKITVSDVNGKFNFIKLQTGTYSIKCTHISHESKLVDSVYISDKNETSLNITLDEKKKGKEGETVTIVQKRTKANAESVATLLIEQKNRANTSDGISTELLKKTPDRLVSDAVKRISGASIQDERFAIIRGLNDRYNAAFINGTPLPSTESDRKAFAFDIYPSSILDNLVIYKTATPDKTGDFAGGIIDITTKTVSNSNNTTISISTSYNSLLTGKTRYFSEHKGKTDFLGIDDGNRGIPSSTPNISGVRSANFAAQAEMAKAFSDYKWGVKNTSTLPNYNFQATKNLSFKRKEKEFLNAVLAINYGKNFAFFDADRDVFSLDKTQQISDTRDSVYNDETVVAFLANFGVKLNNYNSISFKNNLSINTDNKLIKRLFTPDIQGDPTTGYKDVVRSYTSNQIASSQLIGEHKLKNNKTVFTWVAANTSVKRDLPIYARTSYSVDPADPFSNQGYAFFNFTPSQLFGSGTMFSASTNEIIRSIKVEAGQKIDFEKIKNNFKIGFGVQNRIRNFESRLLGLSPYAGGGVVHDFSLDQLPENQIFLPQNLGKLANGKGGFLLRDGTTPFPDYFAKANGQHIFLMNDQRIGKKLRLVYGARIEKYLQVIDPSKQTDPSYYLDTTVTDILPSANVIYSFTNKLNLRLSYSKTLNRPEFRELAPFLFYDYQAQYSINGNTTLQRATIDNYDVRVELFPGSAQLVSVSGFIKRFKNPIEVIFIPDIAGQAFYGNVTSAEAKGLEVEFRTLLGSVFGIKNSKHILNDFTLSANAAFIDSKIRIDSTSATINPAKIGTNRPMQGQSPFLYNGSLSYSNKKLGLSTTLSYNQTGDRINIAGNYIAPDLYEKGRTVLDFQIAKTLLKNNLEIKFNVKDILAQNYSLYNDFDKSKTFTEPDQYFLNYKMPRNFSVSFNYKF